MSNVADIIMAMSITEVVRLGNELREQLGEESYQAFMSLLSVRKMPRWYEVQVETAGMIGKINVIKTIREFTGCTLKEAKDMSEQSEFSVGSLSYRDAT